MKGPFALWKEPLYLGYEGEPDPWSGVSLGGGDASVFTQLRTQVFDEARKKGYSLEEAKGIADKVMRDFRGGLTDDALQAEFSKLNLQAEVDRAAPPSPKNQVLQEVQKMEMHSRTRGRVLEYISRAFQGADTLPRQQEVMRSLLSGEVEDFAATVNDTEYKRDFQDSVKIWREGQRTGALAKGMSSRDLAALDVMLDNFDDDQAYREYTKWHNSRATAGLGLDPAILGDFQDTSVQQWLFENGTTRLASILPEDFRNSSAGRQLIQNSTTTSLDLFRSAQQQASQRDKARAQVKILTDTLKVMLDNQGLTRDQRTQLLRAQTDLFEDASNIENDFIEIGVPAGMQASQFIASRAGQTLQRSFVGTPSAAAIDPANALGSIGAIATAFGQANTAAEEKEEAQVAPVNTEITRMSSRLNEIINDKTTRFTPEEKRRAQMELQTLQQRAPDLRRGFAAAPQGTLASDFIRTSGQTPGQAGAPASTSILDDATAGLAGTGDITDDIKAYYAGVSSNAYQRNIDLSQLGIRDVRTFMQNATDFAQSRLGGRPGETVTPQEAVRRYFAYLNNVYIEPATIVRQPPTAPVAPVAAPAAPAAAATPGAPASPGQTPTPAPGAPRPATPGMLPRPPAPATPPSQTPGGQATTILGANDARQSGLTPEQHTELEKRKKKAEEDEEDEYSRRTGTVR